MQVLCAFTRMYHQEDQFDLVRVVLRLKTLYNNKNFVNSSKYVLCTPLLVYCCQKNSKEANYSNYGFFKCPRWLSHLEHISYVVHDTATPGA